MVGTCEFSPLSSSDEYSTRRNGSGSAEDRVFIAGVETTEEKAPGGTRVATLPFVSLLLLLAGARDMLWCWCRCWAPVLYSSACDQSCTVSSLWVGARA